MFLIDTHCHPQMPRGSDTPDDVIKRALDQQIGLIAIGTTVEDSLLGVRLAEKYPNDPVYAAVGIHPTDEDLEGIHPAQLHALLDSSKAAGKIVGIGETGLDYFHVTEVEDQDLQADMFEQHIILAQERNLPLIVHCRDKKGEYEAYEHVATLLRRHQMKNFVMHCFSGRWQEAEIFLELGGMLSFTGVITFPKSEEIQEVVKKVPADRYLLETDAPFLAPVPHRGKDNEPAWVTFVAEKAAELRGETLEAVAAQSTKNATAFFRLPA